MKFKNAESAKGDGVVYVTILGDEPPGTPCGPCTPTTGIDPGPATTVQLFFDEEYW